MLGDRAYMRGPSFGSQRSLAIVLLIANTMVFVLQSLLGFWAPSVFRAYFYAFALSTDGLASGYLWQLVSYQFMHAGILHLLVNMIVLYFFGRAVEEALGRKAFLQIYLLSGVVGGLLQMLMAALFPAYFGKPVVGASGCVLGLLATYAALFPQRQITLLLFFIIPVSLKARTLLLLALGFSIFGLLVPMGNVAEAAHLGGILTGLAYVHWVVRNAGWPSPSAQSDEPPRPRVLTASAPKRPFWQRSKPVESEDLPPAEFISQEVDPILDKISAYGIQSLTERERRILEAARAKMAKR
jgi:membrane associated rhomboid family serine protease